MRAIRTFGSRRDDVADRFPTEPQRAASASRDRGRSEAPAARPLGEALHGGVMVGRPRPRVVRSAQFDGQPDRDLAVDAGLMTAGKRAVRGTRLPVGARSMSMSNCSDVHASLLESGSLWVFGM